MERDRNGTGTRTGTGVNTALNNIFRRVCKISSNGIFKNPIWPPPLHEIIKIVITPSVFVIETYTDLGSMAIGIARGASGTRAPNNFHKQIQYGNRDFMKSLKKMAITPSVFVIDTYFWTLYLYFKAWGT